MYRAVGLLGVFACVSFASFFVLFLHFSSCSFSIYSLVLYAHDCSCTCIIISLVQGVFETETGGGSVPPLQIH